MHTNAEVEIAIRDGLRVSEVADAALMNPARLTLPRRRRNPGSNMEEVKERIDAAPLPLYKPAKHAQTQQVA